MKRHLSCRFARGVTLVELVVSIAVIAIAGAALAGTLAYLNNILDKSFASSPGAFNDVNDYNGLNDPVALDAAGNAAGNFRVQVSVGPGALNGVPAAAVRRIDVTVTYGNGNSVVASGYRTNYP